MSLPGPEVFRTFPRSSRRTQKKFRIVLTKLRINNGHNINIKPSGAWEYTRALDDGWVIMLTFKVTGSIRDQVSLCLLSFVSPSLLPLHHASFISLSSRHSRMLRCVPPSFHTQAPAGVTGFHSKSLTWKKECHHEYSNWRISWLYGTGKEIDLA